MWGVFMCLLVFSVLISCVVLVVHGSCVFSVSCVDVLYVTGSFCVSYCVCDFIFVLCLSPSDPLGGSGGQFMI